jgi:hypothetical protein
MRSPSVSGVKYAPSIIKFQLVSRRAVDIVHPDLEEALTRVIYRVLNFEPGSSNFRKIMNPRFGGGCMFRLVPVHKRVTERAAAFVRHRVIHTIVSKNC